MLTFPSHRAEEPDDDLLQPLIDLKDSLGFLVQRYERERTQTLQAANRLERNEDRREQGDFMESGASPPIRAPHHAHQGRCIRF